MIKAHLTLPNGTKIHMEGDQEDIEKIISTFSDKTSNQTKPAEKSPKRIKPKGQFRKRNALSGPKHLIINLIETNFFKERRKLSVIRTKLEEAGHIYPVTTISPALVRLVREKQLRRLKESGDWVYVS